MQHHLRAKGVPRSLLLRQGFGGFPEVLTKGNWRRGTIFFCSLRNLQSFGWQAIFSLPTICCHGTSFRSVRPSQPKRLLRRSRQGTIMKCVYLLQSLSVPTQRYVGVTANLEERLRAHNAGASSHTSKYRPWKIVTYLCFQDERRAAEFERYLKTGSGQAFANKRLW